MARKKAKAGPAQKIVGACILAALGLIVVWLLVQQASFNPAVKAALQGGQLKGRPLAAAGQAEAATAALIPEAPGFIPLGPAESFGPETLSDKINGKAELYLAAGFQEMSCRSFTLKEKDKAHVEVFVYDMGSSTNAFAVFSSQRRPGFPDSPGADNAYATGNALFFAQGKYYVEVVADRASPAVQEALQVYFVALLDKFPAGPEASGKEERFPKEGLTPDSVRLSAADTFGLEGFNNVFTGEYTLKNGAAAAFLAARDTPEQAQADARRYREFLAANGYQKIQAAGAPQGMEVHRLDNSFEMVWVQGRTVAGVHDASSAEAALELAGALKEALQSSK
jgi:hypothetical protein